MPRREKGEGMTQAMSMPSGGHPEFRTETMTYAHCQHCGRWFRTDLRFATVEDFELARIKKSTRTCPYCRKRMEVRKEHLRFDEVRNDARIRHTEGRYFL